MNAVWKVAEGHSRARFFPCVKCNGYVTLEPELT